MSALASFVLLAAADDKCTGECEKSGPWGLAIVLVLCVLCYFLFKSMSRHLRKVRQQFPTDAADQPAEEPADEPVSIEKKDPPGSS